MGVWIGGVWNGHFPESEKYLCQRPKFPQKSWKFRRKSDFAKFRAPKFEISEPEKNAIPYPQPFHTPTRLPPIFGFFLTLKGLCPFCKAIFGDPPKIPFWIAARTGRESREPECESERGRDSRESRWQVLQNRCLFANR